MICNNFLFCHFCVAFTICKFVIVRDYFSLAVKKGMYEDIVDIGSYFTSNSEFDCVLEKKSGGFAIYEVKYYSKPLKESEIIEEIEQVKKIKGLNVKEIGFVCSSGYESKVENATYLSLEDIFFE